MPTKSNKLYYIWQLAAIVCFLVVVFLVYNPQASRADALDTACTQPPTAYCQYKMGDRYASGKEIPRDFKKAVKWYRLSADQDAPQSQFTLGYIYLEGCGIEKNPAEALRLLTASANQGFTPAQAYLGWMFQDGLGVRQDNQEAYFWFSLLGPNGFHVADIVKWCGGSPLNKAITDNRRAAAAATLTAAQVEETALKVKDWKSDLKAQQSKHLSWLGFKKFAGEPMVRDAVPAAVVFLILLIPAFYFSNYESTKSRKAWMKRGTLTGVSTAVLSFLFMGTVGIVLFIGSFVIFYIGFVCGIILAIADFFLLLGCLLKGHARASVQNIGVFLGASAFVCWLIHVVVFGLMSL